MLIGRLPVPIFRGPRIIFGPRGTLIRVLAPITVLPDLALGNNQAFAPDAFVALPQPLCQGATDDGCVLDWQNVPTQDGGGVPACVQFCPPGGGQGDPQQDAPDPQQAGAPPPVAGPQPVGAQRPQAAARGARCEVEVYRETNFRGEFEATNENLPELNEAWDNQIASLRVLAGTWDFFADENYGGIVMRLPPGEYRELGPQWNGAISSFMCVQPSA